MDEDKKSAPTTTRGMGKQISRRAALTRLGLAASAVYIAPVLAPLNRAAAKGSKDASQWSGATQGGSGSKGGKGSKR
ncbi:MAG: hypothetical protein HN658_05465 [Rhodospirillales bacterium]|jgi:hypothetical protein|nr:hypothetical protein [Rhodospirillales bacterium]MBT4005954.1 hypothetical protein [Rhodospirillales bacterium]MBT5076148.1 hypothetical protein [Rhodospirillales bacterium]MBT5114177.1 hypothetical protein [Rhodospirillales bacterium]MBT5673234.1 hypothetical protein [Rhodospirillales bacterium]